MSSENDAAPAVTVDRRSGPYGEVVLRRRGTHHEIIANGVFLMDTSDGRSERLLIRAAAQAVRSGSPSPALLIGGLGVGFSLAEAAADPRWGRITVVEREPAVLAWHTGPAPGTPRAAAVTTGAAAGTTGTTCAAAGTAGRPATGDPPLAHLSGDALADPRVALVEADLLDHLATAPQRCRHAYDAVCLDIDNGPDWTVTEGNTGLYAPAGLAACRDRLTPGGVLAVWSARPSPAFEAALRAAGFTDVRTEEIPVRRGAPDAVHLAVRPADTARGTRPGAVRSP
ncbi:spermidine synthase [Streptomyces sp. WMMC500]|uniref:spermidine synthase n=1 Tax=Streptomyces sp. WMMC500 TaxID=3015154 RepID=UPI00248BF656|nr:spermidine synthase [Streptomyces sp. WMMC500]WBB63162.1 spermidine synthase [Streptomyces sp. WMMC500]